MGRLENFLTINTIRRLSAAAGGLVRSAPGIEAALAAKSVAVSANPDDTSRFEIKTRINDSDIERMNAFPANEKTRIMETINSLTPLSNQANSEPNYYGKTMMRLRDEGYSLIDMQSYETALTMVWYHKSRMPYSRVDVTMILWELQEDGETTTVITWRV